MDVRIRRSPRIIALSNYGMQGIKIFDGAVFYLCLDNHGKIRDAF